MIQRAGFLTLVVSLALSCSQRAVMTPAPVATAPAAPPGAAASSLPGLDAPAVAPARRQIVRNAALSVETDDPGGAQQRAVALAERLGGHVLSSDAVNASAETGRAELRVSLVLRVPAAAFAAALEALRGLGRGAGREQVSGQDVTEEYVDLEARIRTQRALEAQLLEILKTTRAVGEMMEVHGHLAAVRGEIEKMDGRRRFLDDQTSLSTIRLEILGPAARRGPGFDESVHRAIEDLVGVASGIVNGAIRLVGVVLPVLVLIVIPGWTIARAVFRRRKATQVSRDRNALETVGGPC